MAKRTRRTPEQIAADLKLQYEKITARIAKSEYDGTPAIMFLAKQSEEAATNAADAKKGLSDKVPAQSFAHRITSHQNWVTEIVAREAAAVAQMAYYDQARPVYDALMSEAVTKMQAGEDESDVQTWVESELAVRMESFQELAEENSELSALADNAEMARKAFIAQAKNQPEPTQG